MASTPKSHQARVRTTPNDISIDQPNSEFFQKFMHGQPLVDISHSMSFSFNQLKTSTEKSNRESFHESDMVESQNLNLKMISSNIRLLEEIQKNQALEQQVVDLQQMIEQLISENKDLLALVNQQQKQIISKEEECNKLRQEVMEYASTRILIPRGSKKSSEYLGEQFDKQSEKRLNGGASAKMSQIRGPQDLEAIKSILQPTSIKNCVVNDIHLNCQFRFTSNTPKTQEPQFNRTATPKALREQLAEPKPADLSLNPQNTLNQSTQKPTESSQRKGNPSSSSFKVINLENQLLINKVQCEKLRKSLNKFQQRP